MGEGFEPQDRDLYVYDRLVCRHMGWNHVNHARCGASNYLIFLSAAQSLRSLQFNKIFVQWSSLNRVWFFPGPDTEYSVNARTHRAYHYRDLHVNVNDKKQFQNLIRLLNHDYHNILQLIDYCCILDTMSKQLGCDVYFINGLVPWTADLDVELNPDNPADQLSDYTKSMLDFDTRSTDEIIKFFRGMQDKFKLMPRHIWINLFESMHAHQLDMAPLDNHPGIHSHKQTADMIINFLTNLQEGKNA